MRRRLLLVVPAGLAAGLLLSLGGCGKEAVWPDDGKPRVVVSFAPLYCFAANVAGGDAVVKNLMTSTGPHDFNPTDVEARLVRGANLFFVNGLELDADKAAVIKRGSGNQALKVVKLGDALDPRQLLEGQCNHDHDHGHHHDHGHDPHIWLSPDLAEMMVTGIREELKTADPGNSAGYGSRAVEYTARLRQLKAEGVELLAKKTDRKIVTFHESLAYFAQAFNLEIAGFVQKKPGVEPNAKELEELVKLCEARKVRLIAVEPQYAANTSAKAVLDELKRRGIADAALVEIDPLETVQPAALTPDWYEVRMRANLEALARAMK